MTYLFIDTETTGLDPDRHHVWEIGYAFDDEPVQSFVVTHSLVGADPTALEIGDYWRRVSNFSAHNGLHQEAMLLQRIKDETDLHLVGANPRFDVGFLRRRWQGEFWTHRIIDVQVHAMGAFRSEVPLSLTNTARLLRQLGFEIPENQHTAASDVDCTRAIFTALGTIYKERR